MKKSYARSNPRPIPRPSPRWSPKPRGSPSNAAIITVMPVEKVRLHRHSMTITTLKACAVITLHSSDDAGIKPV